MRSLIAMKQGGAMLRISLSRLRSYLFTVSIAVGLFVIPSLQAKWESISSKSATTIELNIDKMNSEETMIHYSVPGFNIEKQEIEGKDFFTISIPGISQTDQKGLPALPRLSKNIMIPVEGMPSYEVVKLTKKTFKVGEVTPSKGPLMRNVMPSSVPFTFGALYSSGGVFPAQNFKMGDTFFMRRVRGVTVDFYPITYDASTEEITVVTDLLVKVKTENNKGAGYFKSNIKTNDSFMRIYRNHFANYDHLNYQLRDIQPEHFVAESNKMLIISASQFMSGMAPFVAWKKQKGLEVKMVSVDEVGTTYQEIKTYIQNEFDTNGLSFVLLVGDAEHVTYHKGTSGNAYGNEADPMYGLTVGNDSYPDLFVSRFSVKNDDDLANIVTRVINYEKNPDPNGDWYSKASGIASNEGTPTDYERAEMLRNMLMGWHYTKVDKFYDPGVSPSEVTSAINKGRGFINYIGHGSKTAWVTSGVNNGHIDALKNGDKLPFIVSVACVNGEFGAGSDSFAERWLKAGSADNPKGAIAVYASSTNQSWVPPTVGQKEISNLLTKEKVNTIGGLFFNGVVAVLEDNSGTAKQTFETWHIFGDASLQVRTKKPTSITAEMPGSFFIGSSTAQFKVGEKGIAVGVVQGDQLLGSATSGDDGIINLTFKKALKDPGQALVTFTGFNKVPHIKTVPILPPVTVTLSPESRSIDEAMAGTFVEIELTDFDGTPAAGVALWAESVGYKSEVVYTDDAGSAKVKFLTSYGPNIKLLGKRDADSFMLMEKFYPITGAKDFLGSVKLSTDMNMEHAFAVGFPGKVYHTEPVAGTTLHLFKDGEFVSSVEASELTFTPTEEGLYRALFVKDGYNEMIAEFPAIMAQGTLNVTVQGVGAPLTGVKLTLSKEGMDDVIVMTEDGKGAFEELAVGEYQLKLEKFGFKTLTLTTMVKWATNILPIELEESLKYKIAGNVSLESMPIKGKIKVYKDGEGEPYKYLQTGAEGEYEIELPGYSYKFVFTAKGAKRKIMELVIEDALDLDVVLEKSSGVLVLTREGSTRTIFKDLLEASGVEVTVGHFNQTDPESWFDYSGVVIANGKANQKVGTESDFVNFAAEGGKVFVEGGEIHYKYRYDKKFMKYVLLSEKFMSEKVNELAFGGPIKPEETFTMPENWGASDTFTPVEGAVTLATSVKHEGEAVIASNGNGMSISLDVEQMANDQGQRDRLLTSLLDYWLSGK